MLVFAAELVEESEGKEDEDRSCLGKEEMAKPDEDVMLVTAETLSCSEDAMKGWRLLTSEHAANNSKGTC